MTAALVAGLLAGYGIAIPVGAVATYLVALSARTSLRTGVCAALGVATADGLYALIAVIGGSALTGVIEPIMLPLRLASAVILIVLAVHGGVTAISRHARRQAASPIDPAVPTPLRAYLGLLGLTMMNPMTVIYFTALVLGSRTVPHPLEQAVFVLAAFVASASWQLLLAGGGTLLGKTLTGSRGRLVTALASSALIAVLAVHLLLSAP
ncbi:lysine transporter LysE [Nonomuraea deserti]|uniref:Lysine transporter LysE n=2 Tax=Nonomuraea deserti TaxID=1848322 RepID=A0A4R4U787_9ACTN|nr:lysine transporter LysE [Nonomuraea deserti]